MADKLILNASVTGLNSFQKLNSELNKIKTNSSASLSTLSKKTSDSIAKIKTLGINITPLKSKFESISNSKPYKKGRSIRIRIETIIRIYDCSFSK